MNVATTPDSRRSPIPISTSRNTRYSCHIQDRLPPDLDRVIAEFDKRAMKQESPAFNGQPLIRYIAKSATNSYRDKGPQDDLARFLLDTGILIPDPQDRKKQLYFDRLRGYHVADCCRRCTVPDPVTETAEVRIKRVTEDHARRIAESRMPILPPEPVVSANTNGSPTIEEVHVIPVHITKALDEADDNVLFHLMDEIPKMLERRELERRETQRRELLQEQERLSAQRAASEAREREAMEAAATAQQEQLTLESRAQEIAARLEALGHKGA